jgi:hypothetical protein
MKKFVLLAGLVCSLTALADNSVPTTSNPTLAGSVTSQPAQDSSQNISKFHINMPKLNVCLYADLAYSEGAVLYAEHGGVSYKCISSQDSMSWQEIKK